VPFKSIGDKRRLLPWLLAYLWTCFLIRGCFFATSIPVWEPVDEYSHFAYVAHVALGAPLITEAQTVPPDVTASFELVPLPKLMVESLNTGSHQSHESYWRLSDETRRERQAKLRGLPPATARNLESAGIPIYERQQPPLYYWLLSPLYLAFRDAPLPDRVFLLRLAGVLLASIVVPIAYRIAETFGGRLIGLTAAALLVAMPQLLITASRIGNEALAIGVGASVLWAAVQLAERPSWKVAFLLALAVSAALLTKAYFLSTFVVLIAWFAVRFRGNRLHLLMLLPLLFVPMAASGWWYLRNLRLTGSLSGEQVDSASRALSWGTKARAALSVNWLGSLDSLVTGHTFACGWTVITVRAWMYHLISAIWLIAVLGVVAYLFRRRDDRGRTVVSLSTTLAAGMMATLAYHVFVSALILHQAATSGSYLFSIAAAESILLVAGITFWWRRYGIAVAAFVALLFAAIDLFGMNIYALPYYAGLTAHVSSGSLPAWKLGRAVQEAGLLFQHLAMNKPQWVTAGGMTVLWVLYAAATLAVPIMIVSCFRPNRSVRPG
jgi:4-amino-4-deoxy-L-arabinose transferase-like glycosyltransferase